MKITFWENKHGSGFELTPETPAEVAQLVRAAKSSKKEAPSISVYFSGDNPTASIWMKKVSEAKQNSSVTNH